MAAKIRSALVSLSCAVALIAQQVLDNDAILKLVKAGLSDDVIVGMVNNQAGKYSTSADDVITLKSSGVSDKIIAAIVNKSSTSAQPSEMKPKENVAATVPASELILHDATPVRLRLNRTLSSADATVGDSVDFEVLDDVSVDDVLVIPRGTIAIATITKAEHKKRMARGGKLDLNIDYVRIANGDKIALRAVKETSGGGHTGAMTGGMVATALVFFPAAPFFLFMHGKDTTIPKGTEITAYVNGEIKLDREKLKVVGSSVASDVRPEQKSAQAAPAAPIAPPAPATVRPESSADASALVGVTFTSNPPGALVLFAGMAFSNTPFVTKLQPGKYQITMTLDGYAEWTGEITVEASKPSTVVAQMAKR
jgi:hypothetical protein